MASSSSSTYLLPLSLLLLLFSPTALSSTSTCKSTTFTTPNKTFTSCTDLPHLSATLHWSFSPSTSSLSIAFSAPSSSGWVAWAINPTSLAMAGSQALLAYKAPNGSVSVATYNIQSYSFPTAPGNLSYKVSGIGGEVSNKKITVFGTWELPPKTVTINQVWQVGPSVTNGMPTKHAFAQDNLSSMGKLALTTAAAAEASASPAGAPAGSPAAAGGGGTGGAAAPVSGKNGAGVVSVGVGVWLGVVMGAFGFLF